MSDNGAEKTESSAKKFAEQAHAKQSSLVGEIFAFLRYTRKWWLAPAILLLLLVGLLVVFGGTAVAPFIYTLF